MQYAVICNNNVLSQAALIVFIVTKICHVLHLLFDWPAMGFSGAAAKNDIQKSKIVTGGGNIYFVMHLNLSGWGSVHILCFVFFLISASYIKLW